MTSLKIFAIMIGLLCVISNRALSAPQILGYSVGREAPEIDTVDSEGHRFILRERLKAGPVILVFLRSGLSPCCDGNFRLAHRIELTAKKLRVAMVAIDTEQPRKFASILEKGHMKAYFDTVLNDPMASIIASYHIREVVSEKIMKSRLNDNQDAADNGIKKSTNKDNYMQAVPAIFIVGRDGKISYSFIRKYNQKAATESEVINAIEVAAAGAA